MARERGRVVSANEEEALLVIDGRPGEWRAGAANCHGHWPLTEGEEMWCIVRTLADGNKVLSWALRPGAIDPLEGSGRFVCTVYTVAPDGRSAMAALEDRAERFSIQADQVESGWPLQKHDVLTFVQPVIDNGKVIERSSFRLLVRTYQRGSLLDRRETLHPIENANGANGSSCRDCRFWAQIDSESLTASERSAIAAAAGSVGRCLRLPPVLHASMDDVRRTVIVDGRAALGVEPTLDRFRATAFPVTAADCYCGEYEQRSAQHGAGRKRKSEAQSAES